MSPKKKKPSRKIAKKKPVKRKPVNKAKKRVLKKKVVRRKKAVSKRPKVKENVIGVITHYFPHVRAAVIKLKSTLASGDRIKIKGHTTDFTQAINSMQIDHVSVNQAKKGQEIGLLVDSRVRQHDIVYKV